MGDDKRKLSWREIDKLKDQNGITKLRRKRERDEKGFSTPLKEGKKTGYLRELDRLFQNKLDKEREEALKHLHQAVGKREFKKLALEFIEKYPLPLEAFTLILFLDLNEKELILRILEHIKNNISLFTKDDLKALSNKLKTLRYTQRDPKVVFQIEAVLKELAL